MVKNLPTNAGDTSLIPGSGRSPGIGNGNSLQYSCLENPMDRGVWWATVHGVARESDMTQQLNNDNKYNLHKQKLVLILNLFFPSKRESSVFKTLGFPWQSNG